MKNTPPLDSPAQKANIGSYSKYGLTALSASARRYNPIAMVGRTVSHHTTVDKLGDASVYSPSNLIWRTSLGASRPARNRPSLAKRVATVR